MEGCEVKSDRCKHGVLRPHECKACADEPSKEEIAAFAEATIKESLTVEIAEMTNPPLGTPELRADRAVHRHRWRPV